MKTASAMHDCDARRIHHDGPRAWRSFFRSHERETNERALVNEERVALHARSVHFLLNSSKGQNDSLAASGNKNTRAMEGDDEKWANMKKKKTERKRGPSSSVVRRPRRVAFVQISPNDYDNHKCDGS